MNSKYFTSTFFIIFAFLCSSPAAAVDTPRALGDHLFAQGSYDAAITEYKRFLFFQPDHPRAGEVYHKIGLAYRAQGLWTQAINALRTATHYAVDKNTKSEYQLTLAVTLIANQDYDLAQLELIKVTLRAPSAPLSRRAIFLQTVAYLYQFRWEEAREALQNWTTDETLDSLFDAAVNTPRKSVTVARVLSRILPGAGHIYAGDWRGGLNAFLLNGALGFVTVDAALDGHYTDAALWASLVFIRYYRGNIFRAGAVAETFNRQASRRAAENILQRLQTIAEREPD